EEIRRRIDLHAERLAHGVLLLQHRRERELLLREPGRDGLARVAEVHRDHVYPARREFLVELLQARQLLAARRAAVEPEIDEQRPLPAVAPLPRLPLRRRTAEG